MLCIHCNVNFRQNGLYCNDCHTDAIEHRRAVPRPSDVCLNRGRPVRAVKVQRVIDRYGDDLCSLDPPIDERV